MRRLFLLVLVALATACAARAPGGDAAADAPAGDAAADVTLVDTPPADVAAMDAQDAGPPVACGVALMGASGGRCAMPGETCSTQPRCAMDTRQCVCTASRTWRCESAPGPDCTDAGPPRDVTPADSGPRPDAGTCAILGTYRVSFMGSTLYFRFNADGTWSAAGSVADLDRSPLSGTYTYVGSTLTFRENAGASSCGTMEGRYTVEWDPSCESATLREISDPCAARAMTLNGLAWQRDRSVPMDGGPGPDAGPDARPMPDGAPPGDGGTCAIAGTYTLSVLGTTAYFRFGPGATWAIAETERDLDAGPYTFGTYTYSSATGEVTLADDRGCPMGSLGRYTVVFDASCRTATLRLVRDDCMGRDMALDGAVLTRVR